mmetsp:Transcript_50227/g.79558  ORF Transcript_50227/g.79558 Transcript_50227/m.79558 type:complete len:212 (+) Transcript_50227:262-897(+)
MASRVRFQHLRASCGRAQRSVSRYSARIKMRSRNLGKTFRPTSRVEDCQVSKLQNQVARMEPPQVSRILRRPRRSRVARRLRHTTSLCQSNLQLAWATSQTSSWDLQDLWGFRISRIILGRRHQLQLSGWLQDISLSVCRTTSRLGCWNTRGILVTLRRAIHRVLRVAKRSGKEIGGLAINGRCQMVPRRQRHRATAKGLRLCPRSRSPSR